MEVGKGLFYILTAVYVAYTDAVVPYQENWIDQDVDHFNFYSTVYGKTTYKQKYLVQDKWWSNKSGPIFFYTGNEAPVTYFWNNCGFIFDIAPAFKALVVFAEHRYYGDSLPFGVNQSFQHPYVDLLTVEQALADFAQLVTHIKAERNATRSPVIAFGGSYGGMLAAWMRFKYPNIVDGAIAASAPIFLVGRVVDRDFFFTDVTKDFHDAIDGCDAKVKQAFDLMKHLSTTQEGLQEISSSFKLCEVLNSTDDYRRQLVGWIRNAFTSLAMFDYPYSTESLPANPVKVACEKLVNSDPVKGLAEAVDVFYGSPSCHNLWNEYVQCADPTGCGTGPQSLAWDYQACTEMLMPAGTNNLTDMFPELSFTLEERAVYCKKQWIIEPRLDWMKINMWGKDIQHSSNIVFSNGNLDPWHRGGVLQNVSESLVTVMIDGGAHHLDLRASSPSDPESVKKARDLEVANVQNWIKKAKREHRKKKSL